MSDLLNQQFNKARLHNKGLAQLMGILRGIAADRQITEPELLLLHTWMKDNRHLHDDPDVADLLDLTTDILEDGIATAEELEDLKGLIDTVLEYSDLVDESDPLAMQLNKLLGIVQGVVADEVLKPQELDEITGWVQASCKLDNAWPANVLRPRISEVLADGVVTAEEQSDLLQLLNGMVGNWRETGSVGGVTMALPWDDVGAIDFSGQLFCLTGAFAMAKRKDLEGMICERGGRVHPKVRRDMDFLVAGGTASRDWAMSSYGRKIEYAMKLRDEGLPIAIINEAQFAAALGLG